MNISETVIKLNDMLLAEMPQYAEQAKNFDKTFQSQRRLLRSLMNVRPPMRVSEDFLHLQDELLKSETVEKGIVDTEKFGGKIVLWQGDITRLKIEKVVFNVFKDIDYEIYKQLLKKHSV